MNAIVELNLQKMTSLEISELVEKRHDNVKRTVESLVNTGVIIQPQIEDEQSIDTMGRPRTTQLYVFSGEQGKRDSIVVVAQLCPEFTARLVDRWQELEAQVSKPIDPMQLLSDPNVLRSTLLTYSEKVIELETKVVEMEPTVKAYNRIAVSDGGLCLTDAAKTLQEKPKAFISFLSQNKWIYKRAGGKNWIAYQDKIQAGYLEHKVSEIALDDGSTKIREQVKVTPKGLTKLNDLLINRYF